MVTRQSVYRDREIEFTKSWGDIQIVIHNTSSGNREFAYLTDEVAIELADFILANVERPKPKTAADQIRELPIGGKFRFTDSQSPAVNVKVSDTHFWHGAFSMVTRIAVHETTHYGIEVVE